MLSSSTGKAQRLRFTRPLTGKDATLTIGSILLEWLGARGVSAAALAGFLLLAAALVQTRRVSRLKRGRVRLSLVRTRWDHR